MNIYDTHCHYNDKWFDEDREELLKNIQKAGVKKIINAGYNLDSSLNGVEYSKKHDFMYVTVGISPNDIKENYLDEIKELDNFLKDNIENEKIVAIGEIGLDYHYDVDREMQKDAFIKQINLANKYNLPIVIHTRDASIDTIEILKNNPVNKKGQFHCCPFNQELIKNGLKMGYYISVAGPITFKNSKNAEEIANLIPIDRILVETDSPYLSPDPLRGKRNDSMNLKYIIDKISNYKKIDATELENAVMENTKKLFGI